MVDVFAFSLTAAVNPTLFAALMVMLVSNNAQRLMTGYLFGAYLTSIACGLVIVFALPESGAVSTSRHTINPALDLVAGFLLIVVGLILRSGPHQRVDTWREKKRRKQAEKGPPRWRRALDRGSPRIAFVVGMALSLPGASYLVALDLLHKQDLPAFATVLCVIAICLMQMILLEIPVVAFAVNPDRAVATIGRFRAWVDSDARRIATWVALMIGALLIIRGGLELL